MNALMKGDTMISESRQCMGGLECIEFFEMLPDIIPDDAKSPKFCLDYEHAMNRLRYECYKGIGKPRKINKGVKAWHHDFKTCAVCGANADEPWHEFCPKCGTRYLENPYTQKLVEPYQMEIDDWLKIREEIEAPAAAGRV